MALLLSTRSCAKILNCIISSNSHHNLSCPHSCSAEVGSWQWVVGPRVWDSVPRALSLLPPRLIALMLSGQLCKPKQLRYSSHDLYKSVTALLVAGTYGWFEWMSGLSKVNEQLQEILHMPNALLELISKPPPIFVFWNGDHNST